MGTDSVTISPASAGAGSAVLGIGAGYVFAPHKYSLERLLMQDDSSFARNFSDEKMKHATVKEKASVVNLNKAAKVYMDSGDRILREEVKPNAKLWNEMVKKVNVDDKFIKEVQIRKDAYLDAIQSTKYRELRKKLQIAQENVTKNPKDMKYNLELKAAAQDFAKAQIAMEQSTKQYREARMSFRSAREGAVLKLPDKGRKISAQWEKVRRAMSDRANLMYEKLATLTKDKNLNNDYSVIKKYIPKARTSAALLGGILAGTAGVIAGVYAFNKSRA